MAKTADEPKDDALALWVNLLTFWGKQRGGTPELPYHPVAYHSLDVAAAFVVLWRYCRPKWVREDSLLFLALLVALHDIGKITRVFQAQAPRYWPRVLGDMTHSGTKTHHGTLGGIILSTVLLGRIEGLIPGSRWPLHWLSLVRSTAGHHGTPPKCEGRPQRPPPDCCEICQDYIVRLFEMFESLFREKLGGACTFAMGDPEEYERYIHRLHFWFAGMASFADWIGSSVSWTNPGPSLEEYWSIALEKVEKEILARSLIPARSNRKLSYRELFGFETPTPMQQFSETVHLPPDPFLMFVEDETGSGKTEAAIMAAHRLMVAGHVQGFYYGLPTMATANAMYLRMAKPYRRLFAAGEKPSLVLSHGLRQVNDGFRDSIADELTPNPSIEDSSDIAAECAAWFSRGGRRSSLADIVVATIDQALFASMPTKFGMLRLLGLSRKVIIIDEIHAYDGRTLEIILRLIELCALLGCPVIALSATLPLQVRNRLARAYTDGLNVEPKNLTAMGYPLVTIVS